MADDLTREEMDKDLPPEEGGEEEKKAEGAASEEGGESAPPAEKPPAEAGQETEVTPPTGEAGPGKEEEDPRVSGREGKDKTNPEVQARIDKMRRKAGEETTRADKAEKEAAYYKGLAEGKGPAPKGKEETPPALEAPNIENFETEEDYEAAVKAHDKAVTKAEVKTELAEERKAEVDATAKTDAEKADKEATDALITKGLEKYDDFKEVVLKNPEDGGPFITKEMSTAIQSTSRGEDIAYHLGKNLEESARIALLPPHEQAMEIGKIVAGLPKPADKPPAGRQISNAPPPATPAGGGGGAAPVDDDKRSIEEVNRERDIAEGWD